MSTRYRVTVVSMDAGPEPVDTRVCNSGAEVIELVHAELAGHGYGRWANARMQQEAQTAVDLLARWRGEPAKYCGYLTRYDVDPLPVGREPSWRELRETEVRASQLGYTRDQLAKHVPGLPVDDPLYPEAQRWIIAECVPWVDSRRAIALGECWGLAVGLQSTGLMPSAYTLASWALATARQAEIDGIDRVRVELRAEIQVRHS